jgi:hypothetical protein
VAKYEIEIPDGVVPDGYEPVSVCTASIGQSFIEYLGDVCVASIDYLTTPRLIVRKKEVAKTARPYNAEEMRNLYIGRARLIVGDYCVDVIGFDQSCGRLLGDKWLDADELQRDYTHLDGTRCEVVE